MLPRKNRLRASEDFKRLYRQGKSVNAKHFVIYYRRGSGSFDRLGFSISKKYGGAVARNKARRRLGEIFKSAWRRKDGPLDLVIVARPAASGLDYQNMVKEVSGLLDKIA